VHAIELLSGMFFRIVTMIVKLAPIGAFGAMAYTIGEHGIGSLIKLMSLMLGFYTTCFLFIFCVLWAVMRIVGLSLWAFLRYIKEEIFIVIGTSSSETVLPQMIEKLTKLGCNKSVAGMVIPTGYSFNLDGTAIYLTMGAMFIAQATNTPMSLADQLSLLALLIITSKGAAGVTGSGFIVLAATLSTMELMPAAVLTIALAQIFAIDRFMSEARAVTNLIGNGAENDRPDDHLDELDEPIRERLHRCRHLGVEMAKTDAKNNGEDDLHIDGAIPCFFVRAGRYRG
jgi:aerobic C4-dicarboxylate transport protein